MGTTAKGYPYPEGTDLVMDGDDAIQALAEAIDAKLPAAMTTGEATIPAGGANPGTITVTFPAGLFSVTPTVVPAGLNPYCTSGVQSASATSAALYGMWRQGNGEVPSTSSTSRRLGYIAVQMAGASTMQTRADEPTEPDATATCPTAGCTNQGIPIPVSSTWADLETGEPRPVDVVQCGVCGTDITSSMQEA